MPLDIAKVTRCAAGPDGTRGSKDDWEKCGGGSVVDVVAEGWGQGHARASALGGAGMMAALAAAANGDGARAASRRSRARRGSTPSSKLVAASAQRRAASRNRIPREVAEVILSGLSYGHRAGTARLACEQVFDAKTCRDIDWIAGKTGTPTFPNDDLSLDDLARLCANDAAPRSATASRAMAACGPLRPYKWYVATYRTDPNEPAWTKAIGVLTERNWIARYRPHPRRRRPWAQSRRGDRDAGRGAPRRQDRRRAMSPKGRPEGESDPKHQCGG